MRYAHIDINLDNLIHNYLEIKKITKNKKICAVIKANACGHGAVLFAKTLEQQNIAMFGVAMLQEAIELRKNGIQTPILIIGFTPPRRFC